MSEYAKVESIEAHIARAIPLARSGPREVGADELERLSAPSPANEGQAPDEVPSHLVSVPGLVGDITRWITQTALYPQPVLALGAALSVVGTAAGRKYAGPTKSGTHLYVLGLAPTGAGKNHPAKVAKRILRACAMAEFVGPSLFASDSAVYQIVSAQPQMLCFMDEFGSYLKKLNAKGSQGHEKAISGVLRTLWNASFDEVHPPAWASKEKLPTIKSPSLSIYGMSVHEEFYAALQSEDVANGFLNRFLILPTQQKPEEVDDPLSDDVVPSSIVGRLQEVGATAYDPKRPRIGSATTDGWIADVPVPWACQEAKGVYRELRKHIDSKEGDVRLLSRVPEMAVRLATIRAIGCAPTAPRIDVDDITWGVQLALWSGERMLSDAAAYMVESEHQGRTNEIIRHLMAAKNGRMTMTDLSRKVKAKYSSRQIREALESLEDAARVEVVRQTPERGAGRPTDWIVWKGGN